MPGTHHLFTVTRWLLRAATLFCFFLIAVLALALGALELAALGLFHLPIPASEMHGLSMPQFSRWRRWPSPAARSASHWPPTSPS